MSIDAAARELTKEIERLLKEADRPGTADTPRAKQGSSEGCLRETEYLWREEVRRNYGRDARRQRSQKTLTLGGK